MYITNNKAFYTHTNEYDLLAFNLIEFNKNYWYLKNPPYLYGHYVGRTRINEDILNYEFSTKYEPKTKKEIYNTHTTKMTFMNNVMKCKFFNKSQCNTIMRKEISTDILKKIVLENNVSTRSISRMMVNELRTILFNYYYRYN